jgi:hypothetical protein
MSAFVVDPEHIHVLLWAAQNYSTPRTFAWIYDNPMRVGHLAPYTFDQVGQMLIDANTASVNHRRHPTTPQQSCRYRYTPPLHTSWSIIELLNALECYEYQSGQPDQWESSQAYAFCREMQKTLTAQLPGYDKGPWAITRRSRPHYRPAM